MTTTTSLSSRALAELKNLLEAHGLHAGLTFLNQRVPYRFSAIYRLSDLQLRRVSFVDKQGGGGEDFAALPLKDSFCEISIRDGGLFAPDSAADERLKYSPYLDAIGAYVGLPINDESGHLFGSFCHYDFCSQPADDQEFEFLEEAVRLLGPFCERR